MLMNGSDNVIALGPGLIKIVIKNKEGRMTVPGLYNQSETTI
jgi:hypothetical protein